MDYQKSQVAQWYANKYILITGGTGFMGKVLLEKLLRSCPEIKIIYLLIRYKRGVTPKDRLDAILNCPLFDVVRKINPKALKKIKLIQGDIAKGDLGLSEEDRDELAQNVSIVFHSAATVKFDESLKYAIEINVLGTESITQLCYEMKKLEAFVYLSTAYSNCNLKEIEEKVYDPPYDLEKLKMCIECLDDNMLDELKKRLIKGRPNTYSFTKAMAESVVFKHSRNLPVTILRPSIVVGTWVEPFPGWVDNLNGPAGVLMSIGIGLLRILIGVDSCVADIIPVDIAINMMITAAWYTAKTSPQNILVYNCVANGCLPITWGEVLSQAIVSYRKFPQNDVLWYPNGQYTTAYKYEILKYFLHIIPAKIVDFCLTIMGKKPLLMQAQKKIDASVYAMAFFTSNRFYFEKKNSGVLFNSMNEFDKKLFNFDFSKFVWKSFMDTYAVGTKKYILHQDADTLESAKNRFKLLQYVYYGLLILFFIIVFVFIYYSIDLMKLNSMFAYKGIFLLLAVLYFYFNM